MLVHKFIGSGIIATVVTAFFCGVAPASASAAAPLCAIMYWDAGYGGEQFPVLANQSFSYIGDHWNDNMSSIKVFEGCKCTIYWDAGFLGDSQTFDATSHEVDVPWIGDEWNDKTSSIECTGQ